MLLNGTHLVYVELDIYFPVIMITFQGSTLNFKHQITYGNSLVSLIKVLH